ncbi:hypothetical protein [Armatimonas sp.]|uniref:hypothetical protein n=1 Tax=Armatimonas sp. TaxID=1872638 RepID=UPI00374CD719
MHRIETRIFKLKHIPPVAFVTILGDPTYNFQQPAMWDAKAKQQTRTLLPSGLESLSPDNLKQELAAQGDPKALDELRELIRLLDTKARDVTLTLSVDSSTATVQATNNNSARLTVVSQGKLYSLDVTPHINGDGSVSLFVGVLTSEEASVIDWGGAAGGRKKPDGSAPQTFRRVQPGEPITFKWGSVTVRVIAVPLLRS